ncbi:MAG: transposase [Clostridium sp.]
MHQRLGDPFKQIKSLCYSSHKKGFYVYAKPSSCDPETAIKYIGRYLGRPVIATSRIDKYDGSMVTFHYNRHEDDKYIQETIPVMDFIKRLIRHIPEKHFKMIRYGGLYARHRKTDQQLHKVISKQKRPILRNFNHWRNAILSSFGYDPLECPICRHKMEFWNFILTISVFPSKNYMRDLCPDLAESVLLHNFLCFYGIISS